MEQLGPQNLDQTNRDNALSRFFTSTKTTSSLRIHITDSLKIKMAIGIYASIGIIFFVGIIAGAISYLYRNKQRKKQHGMFRPMMQEEAYTAEDMDCIVYSYRSQIYFRSLQSAAPHPKSKCKQCEKEEDFLQLSRIAVNMTERARACGRSSKVDALIDKGRRLKRNDGVKEHEDPFLYDDAGVAMEDERAHTCRDVRRRMKAEEIDEKLKIDEQAW